MVSINTLTSIQLHVESIVLAKVETNPKKSTPKKAKNCFCNEMFATFTRRELAPYQKFPYVLDKNPYTMTKIFWMRH